MQLSSSELSRQKVKPLEDLAKIISTHRAEGKVIVHAHGVFDLVHPGHIRYFDAARREGDILVVTLTPDRYVNKGPDRPVFNEQLRAEFLSTLATVDYVAINKWPTAVETIRLLKPDVYVKGSDYSKPEDDITGGIIAEKEAIEEVGGRIHFTDEITFSSSNLLNGHLPTLPEEASTFLRRFRNKYTAGEIVRTLDLIRDLKVLIIGDVIVDEYVFCHVMGQASKSVALNARYLAKEQHTGGVLAIARHISDFCENPSLVSVLGPEKDYRDFIKSGLGDSVECRFFDRTSGPTTVKRRFIERFRYSKIFELSFVDNRPLTREESKEVAEHIDRVIDQFDLVLVADFGHGLMDGLLIELISARARFLAVNAQTNSANTGYNLISKYPKADYVCIDQEEIRLAYSDRYGPLDILMRRVSQDLQAKVVTVTQGASGSLIYSRDKDEFYQTPVFSEEVVDSTGAGDAFLAITSPLVARGVAPEIVGVIGNSIGAMAVKILGNKQPIQRVPLIKYLKTLLA
ncbi:MAG: cytidyltransferase [Candidatus Dadabacteria bacterium]|nr:MAG: cytidyltransferase [Candidatus Dadabacteria bacterium]